MGMKKDNFIKWGNGNYGDIEDNQEYVAGGYVYANILNAILYQTSVVTKGIIESLNLLESSGDYYTPIEIATAIDDTLNNKITLTGNNATITLTVADKTPKKITINNVSTAGEATYAANISGGTSGKYPQLLYQSNNNVTNKFDKGSANGILRMNSTGNGFTWTSPGDLSVESASNIAGGTQLAIPYQTNEGTTGFIGKPSAHYRVLTYTPAGFEWTRGAYFMDKSLGLENNGFIQRTGSSAYTTKAIFATDTSYSIREIYDWFINSKTVRIFSGGSQILKVYTYTDSGKDYYAICYLGSPENPIITERTEDRSTSSKTWTRVYFDV